MQYWDMTLKEISMSIKSYSKRIENDMRVNAVISYRQAQLIAHQVGIVFGSKETPKEIYEAYPGIFPQMEQQAAAKHKRQQDWRIMKERIDAYAAEKRKREERRKQAEVRQQEDGNDNRGTANTDNE